MIVIGKGMVLPGKEIEIIPIRSQGAGGQNVNKFASAVHLRFDILASSLPDEVKLRLMERGDQRITRAGVVVIKAQEHRTQEKNRQEAIQRLRRLIQSALHTPAKRVPTKPTASSKRRRLEGKTRRSQVKKLRGKVDNE